MKGISYLTNENGERTAVVIDLKAYGEAAGIFWMAWKPKPGATNQRKILSRSLTGF